jgi:raffinose/stachyose/melibiose transport system permease protein
MKNRKIGPILFEVFMIMLALAYIYPIVLIILNSFKTNRDLMLNVLALPQKWIITNYIYVWNYMGYPRLFVNTVVITVIGVFGIVLFSSMAAYILSRRKSKLNWVIYLFCIAPMLVPFQTIMITLLKSAKFLNLTKSDWGLGIQYWGFGIPMAVFLFSGFISTIPKEIDESAMVDGASSIRIFFSIIFPLLKPIISTVIVLDVMWIWNDFLLPLLMVNSDNSTRTLTLAAYTFLGTYVTDWQYSMSALVLAVFPSIIFFIFMQKNIVKGITAGAVKG